MISLTYIGQLPVILWHALESIKQLNGHLLSFVVTNRICIHPIYVIRTRRQGRVEKSILLPFPCPLYPELFNLSTLLQNLLALPQCQDSFIWTFIFQEPAPVSKASDETKNVHSQNMTFYLLQVILLKANLRHPCIFCLKPFF